MPAISVSSSDLIAQKRRRGAAVRPLDPKKPNSISVTLDIKYAPCTGCR